MKDPEGIEKIIACINQFPADIKAEALIADLISHGLLPNDYLVFFDSAFKRRYSKDVLKAEKYPVNKMHDVIAIFLARDGLYDFLPEGLFHQSPKNTASPVEGMATSSKRETRIEEEARKFFRPLENEFFYHRLQLEIKEQNILQQLNDNELEDFFFNFWKIAPSLPHKLSLKLIAMLPFVKDIIGDFEMTAGCLGAILDEPVSLSVHYNSKLLSEVLQNKREASNCMLGKTNLGVDMVTNGNSYENCKTLKFTIGPLHKTGIEPYLKDGEISRFIDCFCGFFLPLEMDYELDTVVLKNTRHFSLDPVGYGSILGYTAII